MTNKILESMDMANYYRLLTNSVPEIIAAALFDGVNSLLWKSANADATFITAVDTWSQCNEWKQSNDMCWELLPEDKCIFLLRVTDNAGAKIGLLIDAEVTKNPHYLDQIKNKLEPVIISFRREYALTQELEEMAEELANRYEELNLVYQTDDGINTFLKGREALESLVGNCTDFLDVGLSAIILPEHQITLYRENERAPIPEVHRFFPTLRSKYFSWLQENNRSIVINDISDPIRGEVCPDIPYKILGAPITHGVRGVIGTLISINHNNKEDFTNSDRSLLEVMSRKATKIIQESYDDLTGLINQYGFRWNIKEAIALSRCKDRKHCVVNLDLDQMQVINDVLGRTAGDGLLQQVSEELKKLVREKDVVARIGGDEFGMLLEDCPIDRGVAIANKVRTAIHALTMESEGKSYEISASIGVVPINSDTVDVASILGDLEVAQTAAKERGRNQVQVFNANNREFQRRRDAMHWVGRIQQALREDRFELYAQPIVALGKTSEDLHYEVLVRMIDDEGKILPPGAFMPAAETYNLMPALDRWVIKNSITHITKVWQTVQSLRGRIAINLSGQSFASEGFLEFLIDQLRNSIIPTDWFCFEVTESAAIANLDQAMEFIHRLREEGAKFSLDDFGTGLSSFTYLKNMHVDYLKIDGSFVREIETDPVSRSMVSAINHVAQIIGIETIGEYVENKGIKDQLAKIGVNYGQGYGLGKPEPLIEQLRRFTVTKIASANT